VSRGVVFNRAVGRVLAPCGAFLVGAVLVGGVAPGSTGPALAATTSSPNLIANGCFHDPANTAGTITLGPGSVQIPDWNVGGKGVQVVAGHQWQAAAGCTQSVSLTGGGPGSVSQTVNTTFGDIYQLSWNIAANYACGPVQKRMAVYWEGHLVAVPTFNMTGASHSAMGWVAGEVSVTAADTSSVVDFSDATTGGGQCGATLDGVSLTLQSEVVNGFASTSSSDPYSVAERQMLAKLTARSTFPSTGTPVCSFQAIAAEQENNGLGLLVVWGISPSPQFIKEPPAQRQSEARLVQQYLVGLLSSTKDLYLDALKADRVPIEGGTPNLASWWGVRIQSMSTTDQLMSFEISKSGASSWMAWDNVYGVTSINQALAPKALDNLLYYTQDVAGAKS
jgi:Protein of unknown function (DUF642)